MTTSRTEASLFPAAPESADAVLDGLDPEQRAVATALHGPVCVLAGAGTGKTRAITHRIAYGVRAGILQPGSVLAVTFTARAAGEMRGRLRRLGAGGVQARTFHSAALRQLQFFWPRVIGGELPRLVDRKAPLVAESATRGRLRLDRTELRDVTAEIEWAKVTQTAAEDYPLAAAKAGREAPRDPAEIARVYAGYEELKRERGVLDFEDVLLLTVAVLEDRPDVADQVRAQYQHFVVDEYQDVSPLQQRLLDLWLGGRDSLCVVGDAGQTIYSFTGATPEYLLAFRTRYPRATVVELVRDYRSTPQVVHLANGVLAGARGKAAAHRLELVAQREPGPAPLFTEYADEPAEAEGTARRVRQLIDTGVRPSEIAVLYRVNAQSEIYEQALADAGVPYQLRGAERFFERPEVREAGMLLRGAARAGSGADPTLADADVPGQVRAVLGARGWSPQPPAGAGAARDRWESLAALVRLAEEFCQASARAGGPAPTLADFVAELDARAAVQHAPTVEGVTLASLHAAKGLEWDAVFLVGLTEGTLPITYARTDEQIEEERRLLYVGVTRARVHLALSWALSRSPGGRGGRRPSRFLTGLRRGAVGGVVAGRPGGATGSRGDAGTEAARRRRRGPVRCRVCGRTLSEAGEIKLMRCEDCPSDLDESLYERLRDWRAGRAAELGQPAFCVFTDKTLMAIAERLPAEESELVRIAGVGTRKAARFGAEVLALVAGRGAETAGGTGDEGPDTNGMEGSAKSAVQPVTDPSNK
ncbi:MULTISPECIES: ATP-dependent DNA helicase UvrD2 [Streptomycetaceae]|uniref:DNA 3'-5' helicase n=1 Tax=Streptantibioticus cattleyicolor (strain ATCC 35852 / DSM 46488 / JCM 4925 / NBRC 14057 / NRRL 8057) TaxID=1003195 RepID=F8K4Q2_STREN|nr:ATP-dependent DNA helicase UvrD2 [Streptantibioticus cattleyicolor]AEW96409.1 ATP-dependent DNA helicase [Streptantibioticus cattleyicolor NRRL 8057 = DSM 46488]MYS60919.1 UvrD-helicase domain-containing protein [Streptomyces sp. SID5468]CCB76747.1 putative DNA helicase II homolog [Streptantibioticus cattleyicolor NRRL 8057 = DSM 46488]